MQTRHFFNMSIILLFFSLTGCAYSGLEVLNDGHYYYVDYNQYDICYPAGGKTADCYQKTENGEVFITTLQALHPNQVREIQRQE